MMIRVRGESVVTDVESPLALDEFRVRVLWERWEGKSETSEGRSGDEQWTSSSGCDRALSEFSHARAPLHFKCPIS